MNDRLRMKGRSLQFKLSAWLAMVIVSVTLAVGFMALGSTFYEVNELQDNQLRQIADMVRRQQLMSAPLAVPVDIPDVDRESPVIVQVLSRPGQPQRNVFSTPVAFRADMEEGMQTASVERQDWRVLVESLPTGTRFVVAQRSSVRYQIARNSALHAVLPFFVLIALLYLLVHALIRAMFKPINALARAMNQREQDDLRAMSEADLPTEIRPFVVTINRLLSRVDLTIAGHRRFLERAVNELGTPLDSLSLQSGQLGNTEMSIQAKQRLIVLQGGLRRLRQLLDQSHSVACAQESPPQQLRPVYVRTVLLRVAEGLMPLARTKGIDIGMLGEQDFTVLATEGDMVALVKNLVEDAIQHTPPGGQINLSVRKFQGRIALVISDTGPGISDDDRKRVFGSSYRSIGNEEIGSGQALTTVQAIAKRLGAQIHLENANPSEMSGLRVVVSF